MKSKCSLVVSLSNSPFYTPLVPQRTRCVKVVNLLNLSVEFLETFGGNFLKCRILGVAADNVEIMSVHSAMLLDELSNIEDMV